MTTPGRWSETQVDGHPCRIYEPAEPNRHGYTVLYLHGVHLGDLRDHPQFAAQFDRHGLTVVCPITQRSWWTDRICAEFDPLRSAEQYILQSVVPYVGQRFGATPPRLALLGTSMGGQGALRLALKYPDTFPTVAAISPEIDYYLRFDEGDETLPLMYDDAEAARQDSATLHVHPLYWPRNMWFCCCPTDTRWHESTDRLRMKLAALGIPFQCEMDTSGGGHSFEYYRQMAEAAVGFLADRLENERLRVV